MMQILALFRKALAFVLKPIFPTRCIFCRTVIEQEDVCADCKKNIIKCKSARAGIPLVHAAYAPFYYDDKVAQAVRRYKFMRISAYAKPFSKFMIECIEEHLGGEFDCITWVPISARRLRERGFDQSHLLAQEISEHFHLPLVHTLKKVRHNARQSSKKSAAARRANVIGAYKIIDYDSIIGKRVLIVDDVITTGATVSECARMLRIAGATRVLCVAFAKTKKSKKKN